MDSSFRKWDVKPFRSGGAGSSRWESSYEGAKHGAEKLLLRCAWSPDQERVACGSADRYLLTQMCPMLIYFYLDRNAL